VIVISNRHGEAARNRVTRLRRPAAGPDITVKIPQQIHMLDNPAPE
jgi:hypothetical protein